MPLLLVRSAALSGKQQAGNETGARECMSVRTSGGWYYASGVECRLARPAEAADAADAALSAKATGSIFGAAIGAVGETLWTTMAISPPRTPPTSSTAALSPPPLALDEAAVLGEEAPLPGESTVEAVCTMHDCDCVDGVALVRFAQELNSSTLLVTTAPRVRNYDYVVGKPVLADEVRWSPMSAQDGSQGHVFELFYQGAPSSRIEVCIGPQGRLGRVAVVDASYSPLSAASGMSDASAMLCYEEPEEHLRALRALGSQMKTDSNVGYAPTLEVCIGPALDALPLQGGGISARAAWTAARRFLGEMSSLAVANAERHAASELGRVSAPTALCTLRESWKRSVA
jgi:hypothetical protein